MTAAVEAEGSIPAQVSAKGSVGAVTKKVIRGAGSFGGSGNPFLLRKNKTTCEIKILSRGYITLKINKPYFFSSHEKVTVASSNERSNTYVTQRAR